MFKLSPIFLLWLVRSALVLGALPSSTPGSQLHRIHEPNRLLSTVSRQVPDENPKDVVARIDAELADVDDDTAADDSSDKPDMNEHGKGAGSSAEWDLSGWPMLVLLMPPVGFVTIAQPIMNTYVTPSERTFQEYGSYLCVCLAVHFTAWLLWRIRLSSVVSVCQVCTVRNVLATAGVAAHLHSSLPNLRERRHPKWQQRGTRGRAHVRRWVSRPVGQDRSE